MIGRKLPVKLAPVAVPLPQTHHRVPPQHRLVEPEWSGGVVVGFGSPHIWGAPRCPLRGVAAAPCSRSGSREQGAAAPGAEDPGEGVGGGRGGWGPAAGRSLWGAGAPCAAWPPGLSSNGCGAPVSPSPWADPRHSWGDTEEQRVGAAPQVGAAPHEL